MKPKNRENALANLQALIEGTLDKSTLTLKEAKHMEEIVFETIVTKLATVDEPWEVQ
jgi:hypothetical protein